MLLPVVADAPASCCSPTPPSPRHRLAGCCSSTPVLLDAQRYLYIRWGVELSNMTVVVGESGDTDYDGLLGGVYKTIILEGSFNAAPNQVHAARSYSLQDVVSFDKPGIASVEGYGPDNLKSALQQFGVLKD